MQDKILKRVYIHLELRGYTLLSNVTKHFFSTDWIKNTLKMQVRLYHFVLSYLFFYSIPNTSIFWNKNHFSTEVSHQTANVKSHIRLTEFSPWCTQQNKKRSTKEEDRNKKETKQNKTRSLCKLVGASNEAASSFRFQLSNQLCATYSCPLPILPLSDDE